MNISRAQLVENYSAAVINGDAALFVGAGLSRPSGFVDWRSLLEGCATEIGLDLSREYDLVAVAQYYLNRRGGNRARLNQILRDEFEGPALLTENHRVIGRLPISTIWTTNFDALLEQGLLAAGRVVDIKSRDQDIPIPKRGRDAVVYKMHGDITRPDEIVICKEDYERYAIRHDIFQNALKGDLIGKTFLFVGFSFSDPNLSYMLGHLHSLLEKSKREHYAIMRRARRDFSKSDAEGHALHRYDLNKQELLSQELQRYSIQTHLIDDFGQLTGVLKSIEERTLRNNVFVSGSANQFAEFGEDRMRDFCIQFGELLMTKGYRLVSGVGLNIGDSVVKGALLALYGMNLSGIDDRLVLRPFPRTLPIHVSKQEFLTSYREDMIAKAGLAVFISGTSRTSLISDGVMQEYEVARRLNRIPIPIGATGYAARKIWASLQPQIDVVYRGRVPARLYQRIGDASLSDDQILGAVFEIIDLIKAPDTQES